jgi:hypothetical protein
MFAQRSHQALGSFLLFASVTACQPADRAQDADAAATPLGDTLVVEVTALDYAFQAPNEIPSGWTTFRLNNEGAEHHFMLLNRLPEGKTFEEYGREVGLPFDMVWDSLRTGAMDKAEAGQLLGQLLPAWYASVQQMGGPGLIAAGGTGETTVNLEPGTYVMECYVKTADGEFHVSLGMARQLLVTSESSGAPAPEADVEIAVSNFEIATDGEVTPGSHTVAVHFEEHPEVGLGNDVHLARLEAGTDLNQVTEWMDWMEVNGLREPAPAQFLGGAQEMPVGYTSYFVVDLEHGRYAWIAEASADKKMVKEFVVE